MACTLISANNPTMQYVIFPIFYQLELSESTAVSDDAK